MWYTDSSFNLQYRPFSLTSSSSCLRLLPHPSLYLSFNDMFQNALIMQYWPIQLNFFLFTVCIFLSSLTLCNNFCISHMINPTELLHLFLAPHFRIFQVFVSCFWSVQVSASDVAILQIWILNLLVKKAYFLTWQYCTRFHMYILRHLLSWCPVVQILHSL